MALLVLLLLLPFLPSTTVAQFSPSFSLFLACGATSSINFPFDSPARTFTTDAPYLISSGQAIAANSSTEAPSPLYATARAATSNFSYHLTYPTSVAKDTYLVLRLHFFPFVANQSALYLPSSGFTISVTNAYTIHVPFSPTDNGSIREFFLPLDGSGNLAIAFAPEPASAAFVNAIELFPAPTELFGMLHVAQLATVGKDSRDSRALQALETVYRLNVGGPKVTKENDTLWRTWLPDDPYVYAVEVSVLNNTSSQIAYDQSAGYTREVAPDVVYKTQRAMNVTEYLVATNPGLNFNVTWTFRAEPGSDYLVRLHFCDYEVLSSVVGAGLVFNVYVAQAIASQDLAAKDYASGNMPNQAFYVDYVARAPSDGNLTVSIGKSVKGNPSEGGILNGLEIMKLRPTNLMPQSTGNGGKTKKVLFAVFSAILSTVVLACTVFCLVFVLRRRRLQMLTRVTREENPYGLNVSGVSTGQSNRSSRRMTGVKPMMNLELHISLAEIKAATGNFHERNLIGVGGFGKVYWGVLRDGTHVAVKRSSRTSKQGLPEFQTEIVLLSRIRHCNLVSLVGYCNDRSEMILVYEYMKKGTLRNHLYGSDEPLLSWEQRLEICIGAARGLHFLHSTESEYIIHRDVKSTNILLGDDLVAKVADFGLSRVGPSFDHTHVTTTVKGSFGYLDPEYFKTRQLTDKSDVYSFGVVLFEVLCARPVIDQISLERNQINLVEWALKWHQKGQLGNITDPRIVGHASESSLRKFAEIAEKCTADHRMDRPSMGDIMESLEHCLQLQQRYVSDAHASEASATPLPVDVTQQREPTLSSTPMDAGEDTSITETTVTTSTVFSQLLTRDGR